MTNVEVEPVETSKKNKEPLLLGYMYILKCSDGSYYVGSTQNLTQRVEQHIHGEGSEYAKKRLPVELVYYEECKNIKDAFLREKQVQGWSRKKREALIQNKHELLPLLSKSKTDKVVWFRQAQSARRSDVDYDECGG